MLLTHDHPVTVTDGGIHHRLADHLEQEQRTLADEFARQREDFLDGLLGQDGAAAAMRPSTGTNVGSGSASEPATSVTGVAGRSSALRTSTARGRLASRRR